MGTLHKNHVGNRVVWQENEIQALIYLSVHLSSGLISIHTELYYNAGHTNHLFWTVECQCCGLTEYW